MGESEGCGVCGKQPGAAAAEDRVFGENAERLCMACDAGRVAFREEGARFRREHGAGLAGQCGGCSAGENFQAGREQG